MISYYDWGSFLWAGQTKYFNYFTLMHEGLKLLRSAQLYWTGSRGICRQRLDAQLTVQGTSCQPCSAGTARPKSFIAEKKDCGPCRYGDYPAHGRGDNYSYEYGDFYLDGYAYTHAPNYRNFPLHATCESCGGAAAAPYDAVTGLRSRILGPSHTFIYTNPGVDCAWRCTDGFYKWEADEHTAYCKPCPPNTSSSVDAWHLTYEGKTWAIEKELVENDRSKPWPRMRAGRRLREVDGRTRHALRKLRKEEVS